ncbi:MULTISPECIES: hypothetical protein [Pseudomonas]|uniref:hypothetical protein n=1 Tax=Pseudomonas TaxID=286 RepID=UPI000CFE14EA|nr:MULTISPECIES: hypothetical protein [Pseudomonas]PQZ83965.1 hypothetical protein CQ048_25385 [Pseudomonas trivialis]PRB20024.1 hypothetical protein CQ041_25450 [Pseudomonas sp. MYb60]
MTDDDIPIEATTSDESAEPVILPKYVSSHYLVKFDEMIRFMTSHFSSTVCPQCQKDDGWSIDMEDPDPARVGNEILQVFRLPHASNAKNFKTAFLMSCNACGSVRFIMADHVKDWLKANPVEKK